MNNSPHSTRRRFLRNSAGAFAATAGLARGETEAETAIRTVDRDLAGILRSYGRTNGIIADGHRTTRVGKKSRRLPVSRLAVDVRDRDAFCASFQKLAGLSDRLVVTGNEVRFARDGRLFIIDNRLA